jgi:hypothetical protein
MGRSWRRHAVPPSGWKRTALEAASRQLVQNAASPPALVRPDSSPGADAVILEASVLARLLGVRLLTLEGTIVLSPAQIQPFETPPEQHDTRPDRTTPSQGGSQAGWGTRTRSLGLGLAEAGQLIADSAATLRAVREPDSTRQRLRDREATH